jgi:hypothetical protein
MSAAHALMCEVSLLCFVWRVTERLPVLTSYIHVLRGFVALSWLTLAEDPVPITLLGLVRCLVNNGTGGA